MRRLLSCLRLFAFVFVRLHTTLSFTPNPSIDTVVGGSGTDMFGFFGGLNAAPPPNAAVSEAFVGRKGGREGGRLVGR